MNLALSLQAKGAGGLVSRAGTILTRFGPTAGRARGQLSRFFAIVEAAGARPTFPITACVLARHPALIRHFARSGVEFAAHGLVHNDHAVLSLASQRQSIARAVSIFRAAGVSCTGFRGPYLRANLATDQAVREAGLRYHSSQAVNFSVLGPDLLRGERATAYHRALDLYGAQDAERVAVRPRMTDSLVSIPVAVPDDEIMVDRLHLTDAQQVGVWLAMLAYTRERGDLLTLQLHPERIDSCTAALTATLAEARSAPGEVWIATLDEIARWWQRRAQARATVTSLANGWWRVTLTGDPDATMWVLGAALHDRVDGWQMVNGVGPCQVEMKGSALPVVGVAPDVDASMRAFLEEEGFVTLESVDGAGCGAFVCRCMNGSDEAAMLRALDAAPGPLVRLGRWPAGARSAVAVTGDIDCITLQDFAYRMWETRPSVTQNETFSAAAVRGYR